MNNYFVKDFIFDEEQRETLLQTYAEKESGLYRAGVYNSSQGAHYSDNRNCDHVSFNYKEFPDISLELLELVKDLDPDYPDDLWFAQFEFIRYQGAGQTFVRHNDDGPNGERHNRLYTSVTMIEKSDDLVGGKLQIWTPDGNDYIVDLQPFESIVFPSYYEHEATPLVQGKRVVLISWAQREGRVLTS